MKNIIYLLLITTLISGCNSNNSADQLIDYTNENYSESSNYYIYGSIVRAVIDFSATDKASVDALKDLEKIAYFDIPSTESKATYNDLIKESKSHGLSEYITVEKGSLQSIPEDLQALTKDAKEIAVLIKDENGIAKNLVILMRKKESVIFLVSDGDLEIKKLMNIKLDNTEELEKTLKGLPNIF